MRVLILVLVVLASCGQAPIEPKPILTPTPIPTLLPPNTVDQPPNLTLGHISPPFVIPRLEQDTRVTQYLTDFENTYPAYTTARIPVVFVDTTHFPTNVVAQCHQTGLIEVNEDRWDSFSKERQRNMIWHELGHCLLHRPHLEGTYPDGCPISIMAAMLIQDGCVEAHPELIGELEMHRVY